MNEPRASQVERTSLAWQRTALSVAAAALILARLTLDELGVPAIVVAAAALVLAAVALRGLGAVGPTALVLVAAIGLLCLVELATLV